jgi:hypothetical protein
MNFRTTIVLLILLIGVGGYLWLTSTGSSSSSTVQNTNPQRLLSINSNDVSKVAIASADGSRIVLERHTLTPAGLAIQPAKSDWKILEPVDAYADATKVSDLIDAIVSATSNAQVAIGSSAADFGLDSPQFTVDLQAGPKSAKLDIGRQVKAGDELYVRVEGSDTAQVVSADLLDKLDTTAQKLRLARLIDCDATTANWISIQRPHDPLTLEKVGGQWQMSLPTTRPTTMPVEQSTVSDLISALNFAAAVDFGDANSNADLLIGRPQATLQICDKAPTTQPADQTETIEFGSPDSLVGKNVWVRVTPPGVLATIPKDTMDSILKGPLDLRDRDVVQIATSSIREVRIVTNTPATTQPIPHPGILRAVVLTRRPPAPPPPPKKLGPTLASTRATTGPTTIAATQPVSEWMITSTVPNTDADDAKVDAAIASFNPLRADKYLTAPPTGPALTTYLITITTDKGPPVQITLSDPGESSTDTPTGQCNGLIFAIPRSVITSLDTDFAKTATP